MSGVKRAASGFLSWKIKYVGKPLAMNALPLWTYKLSTKLADKRG
ncbi:hypothetical protein [Siminovitchia sp. FSL W7-1587]